MARRKRDDEDGLPADWDPKLMASEWRDEMARHSESLPGIARRRVRARFGSDLGHVGDDLMLFEVLAPLFRDDGELPGRAGWAALDRRVKAVLGWRPKKPKPRD